MTRPDEREPDFLEALRRSPVPEPGVVARERAVAAALDAFDAEKSARRTQGRAGNRRLIRQTTSVWGKIMSYKLVAAPAAAAGLLVLPVAGYVAWQVMGQGGGAALPTPTVRDLAAPQTVRPVEAPQGVRQQEVPQMAGENEAVLNSHDQLAAVPAAPVPAPAPYRTRAFETATASGPAFAPEPGWAEPTSGDRLEAFEGSPIRAVREHPVSTFSADVDTASYSFVRRALNAGQLPDPDTVRVEEMINYFPYDWPAPAEREAPFAASVSIMPTPWNGDTQLMHVAIKGYDIVPEERPRANLVFLVDTSGSMAPSDRLPMVQTSLRMLLDRLQPDDTVSIVTYAGDAGVALEPTPASDRAAIVRAIDRLYAGGSTAGAAGLREAYAMAERSFVEGGVNRIILATDGDFNVGETSDEALERLVRRKRETGIHLSVLGFGMGNLNDQLMQRIAQNGNGTAAYIDTLAEAQKVLVEEAGGTLFTIAADVKLQVEFNPSVVSEYRLIGYETRALAREDFNNDRVDAGDIGSGHSIAAIYEIVPVGSPAQAVDALRYGGAAQEATSDRSDEFAFLRIRYKLPGEAESRLIERPVTPGDVLPSFAAASDDQRFSVAVAAFGQKLRGTDAVADMEYQRIIEIAAAARGADPFGYRAEFLSLARIASALDGQGERQR